MINDLKPYPAMKDSGVEWLEEVPEHWEVRRGKYVFRCIDERSKTGEEELLTVSAANGVIPRRSTSVTMFKAESYVGHKLCWPNDLVINSLWAWGRGLGFADHHGIVSTAYGVYRLRSLKDASPRYLHRLVRSTPYHWELRVRSKGIWISRLQLTDESFLDSELPLPPLPEQAAIVRYLDHVDRRVRRLTRAKRKLIALLTEQKQAIIHRAVTRGLDPDVPLKDSGVEWLGEVPEHWEVLPLKRIGWFSSGAGFPISEQGRANDEVLFAKVSDMNRPGNERNIVGSANTVSREVARDLGAYIFPPKAIIFPKVGGALLTNKRRVLSRDTCIDNNLMGCVVTGANVDFAFRLLAWLDLGRLAKPGPVPAIGEGEVRDIRVTLPPLPEQAAIVEYLDQATADIDTTITRAGRVVELLNEYRTRLIADVVTGKLDVREAAAELPEVDPLAEADNADDLEADLALDADDLDEAPEEVEA